MYVVDLEIVDLLILCLDGLIDVMGSKLVSEMMCVVLVGVVVFLFLFVRMRRVVNSFVIFARVW